MAAAKWLTLIIHRDGALESRTIRLPVWAVRATIGGAVGLAVLGLLGAAFYGPLLRTAIRVPALEREVERLTAENERVTALASALARAEARYAELRQVLGADVIPAVGVAAREGPPVAPAIVAAAPGAPRLYTRGPSIPAYWPVPRAVSFITRGLIGPGRDEEAHFGIDIAVPSGTPVRATGGGTVEEAGGDPDYGLFVLLGHPDGYQSMYGHASRLLVTVGERVQAGQVIALSGNTGRSTAPHLHFELRRSGTQLDPITVLKEVP